MNETERDEERREIVVTEAAVGYEDAERRWLAALQVLAEYGADNSEDTCES